MIKTQYGPSIEAKTLPVSAHIIPIIVSTTESPKTKDKSPMKFFKFAFESVSSPYPPTYAAIIGKIPREHGLKDAITKASAAMVKDYKVTVVPTLIFVSKDGQIIHREEGFLTESEIRTHLDHIK